MATTIAWDVCHGDESDTLRQRAAAITEGGWGEWDNPAGVAHALTVAATVLDTW